MDTALFIVIFYPSLAIILICYVASFFVYEEETREQQLARWEAEKKDYATKATIPYWDAPYTVSNQVRQESLAYHPGNPNREGCIIT